MTEIKNLPNYIQEAALCCLWRFEDRDGRLAKVPYNPRTGNKLQPNNPKTFESFTVTMTALQRNNSKYDGLGVGIFGDICAIDIDHCVNDAVSKMAADIITIMKSYTEYSPSGTGIRILFKASNFSYDKNKYYINNQKIGLEVYVAGATNKYVTVTGNSISMDYDLMERGSELQIILDKYMKREKTPMAKPAIVAPREIDVSDADVLATAERASNGTLFSALWDGKTTGYNSHSEADIALCNLLAFYTAKDEDQIDRLFRRSGLMREKWDRPQNGSTYGALTIQNAIANCITKYNPQEFFQKKASAIKTGNGQNEKTMLELHPDKNDRYGWHDMGNGNLFSDWYKAMARYCPDRKKWFVYNGAIWQPDTGDLKVMQLCKQLADHLMIYALSIPDEKQRQDYMDFVRRWQKRSYRETIIKDAAGVYPIDITCFDADPMLFNCLNGTLNLKTGLFHDHRADDLLSKISGVQYNPAAQCPRWECFVLEVMQGDQEEAAFLQKAIGYALTGDTRHECFFMLYGPTSRNGKGTTMETFMRLMGDYGKSAKPDTIAQKHTANGSGPSEDIARLAGARFVNISEPDKKMTLSTALVKTLTGNDTITARFLNENSFEYRPQFKLFINSNHLPLVTDVTLFSSGRVKIIPFEKHFTETERDDGLKAQLSKPENLSGILNWCIEGLRLIKETGFETPEAVRLATNEYQKNSDKIGKFLDEEFEANPVAETHTSAAYIRYKEWCARNGYYPENAANFKASMSNLAAIRLKRPNSGGGATNLIIGYELKDFHHENVSGMSNNLLCRYL